MLVLDSLVRRLALATVTLLSTWLAVPGFYAAAQTATEEAPETTSESPEKIEKPFLWKILMEDGTAPQYLLGTIHVPDERVLALHPEIKEALDQSVTLYVEIAPAEQMQQLGALTLGRGQTVDGALGKERVDRINKQLSDMQPGLSLAALPPFKTWAWPLVLPNLEAQLSGGEREVMDMMLVEKATKAQIDVASLEDPKTQLSGFDKLSAEEQLKFLDVALDGMEEDDEDEEDEMKHLVDIYLSGDGEALDAEFRKEFFDDTLPKELADKIFAAIMTDRNKAIADTIHKKLQESADKPHLFAAGAGHFVVGPTVIEYLQELGYHVERIE